MGYQIKYEGVNIYIYIYIYYRVSSINISMVFYFFYRDGVSIAEATENINFTDMEDKENPVSPGEAQKLFRLQGCHTEEHVCGVVATKFRVGFLWKQVCKGHGRNQTGLGPGRIGTTNLLLTTSNELVREDNHQFLP